MLILLVHAGQAGESLASGSWPGYHGSGAYSGGYRPYGLASRSDNVYPSSCVTSSYPSADPSGAPSHGTGGADAVR